MNIKDLIGLYSKTLPSSRTGPLYNVFSYPTKISPEAIALFIATHTKPGSSVLDAFGGSGTTGLAAMLCDRPTNLMLKMASDMGVEPEWGPRNVSLFEIGKLGSFVAKTLCSPPDPKAFSKAVSELCRSAEKEIGWIYNAKDPEGQDGKIRHTIWSDVIACDSCGHETTYWDATVRYDPLRMSDSFLCTHCRKTVKIKECKRVFENVPDWSGGKFEQKKRILVRVYGVTGKKRWQRDPTKDDAKSVAAIEKIPFPLSAPNTEIVWGDLHRSGYHKGIKKLHHFYTHRNFLAVSTMWKLASDYPDNVRDALRLLILSYNSSHSTLMTRMVVKKNQKDFVLTGSQSGVLYISGLPVEKNVIEGVSRKSKSFRDAFDIIYGSKSRVTVYNESSVSMNLPDKSVDYIFTDPPFGAYIPYAEINQINEIWLGETTDRNKEIIVSAAQNKDVVKYGEMMRQVFIEMERVLKNKGIATIVFHSAHADIWRSLASAYTGAGFSVKATSVLDKIQASFKQVVSDISVKGDPLLLLAKGSSKTLLHKTCLRIADEIVAEAEGTPASEHSPQRLYSKFVSRCLERAIDVEISAREFYEFVRKKEELKS